MLRLGYMPSDFHPVVLVLGNHADLSRFASELDAFAEDGQPRRLGVGTDIYSTDTSIVIGTLEGAKRGLWPDAQDPGLLHWNLLNDDASSFALQVHDLASSGAPAGSVTLEHDQLGEVKVKVSLGEWEDQFLSDDASV